jgi:ubiquinone/menaquinone biosynthesis C-methylase UbiE
MWMPARSHEREYLDDHTPGQEVVDKVYRFLKFVNRRLGGAQATIDRFEAFSRSWKPNERIEVLDVASGAADLPRALIKWGRERGFDVRVTASDTNLRALDFARRDGPPDQRLRLMCADVHQMPCRDEGVDYVMCAMFFHHLADHEIIEALRAFDRLTRRGIVVNDLSRKRRLLAWTWLFTRPFHPIVRRDGPLSVRKSLLPAELATLACRAGLNWLAVREHFGHRLTLAGEKAAATRSSEA